MRTFLIGNAPWLGAGALLTFLSSFGQTFLIAVFSGEIRAEFGLSHGAWGAIYTLGTGASALVMLWAGGLADRYRSRNLGAFVLAGLACATLAMAINPFAWLLPVLIFALRFCGQGMLSHIAVVSMSRWFVATRGKALAVAGLGFSFAEALLPLTFVAAFAFLDWRWLWVLAALVCLGSIPVLRHLLRTERTPQSMATEGSATGMGGRHWQRSEVWRHWLFWAMVPALLGPPAFITAFFFQQVPFAEAKGWSHFGLVSLFPIYPAVSLISMLISGWLLDKLGTGRLIQWHQLPLAAAFALHGAVTGLDGAMLALVLMGIAQGANATLPAAFWAEFYGTRHMGSIKALATAIMVAGSALGPGITGFLLDAGIPLDTQFGLIAVYFIVVTGMMAVAVGRAETVRKAG